MLSCSSHLRAINLIHNRTPDLTLSLNLDLPFNRNLHFNIKFANPDRTRNRRLPQLAGPWRTRGPVAARSSHSRAFNLIPNRNLDLNVNPTSTSTSTSRRCLITFNLTITVG